jgi:glucose/arabinose dehydrogenase
MSLKESSVLMTSIRVASVFALMLNLAVSLACAQRKGSEQQQQQGTSAAKPKQAANSPAERTRYEIKAESLPAPNLEEGAASNPPRVVARPPEAEFQLPQGFEISTYAEGDFRNPRWMALSPNGDVFLADSQANTIHILRDANRDGKVDERFIFADALNQPFGMAFWRDYFYVANTNSVVRFRYRPGQTRAEGQPEKVADLPGRGYNQHWTRNIVFNAEGSKMYVTVGSESNVSVEPEPMRAAITEFNPDGSGKRVFATGLRNPVGLAFYPGTSTLWTTVNERDRLGDDLVPDYLTSVQAGGFYGWPYAYIGQNEDPRRKGENPELVKKAIVPDVLIQAHSAALGLVFYEGGMFPQEYRGHAFVALRGSWNRTRRTGYKIIRVPFNQGSAVGGYEDFITGWASDETRREVWGRPVGLLVLPDGSMLITDDGANKIWRVTYRAR